MKTELVLVDEASLAHANILYKLLCERKPWQSISHKQMPIFSEHLEFVQSKPYLVWYLIADVEIHEFVGSVYLTRNNELGIFIFNRFQKCGYGSDAIIRVMERYPGPFKANINPKNMASRAFFLKLGFELIQVTYEF